MAMRILHFLGHQNVFPSNIYPDVVPDWVFKSL
jgi:hypothetical protein